MPRPKTFERWEGALTQREAHIEEIITKMQSGAWLTGVSDRTLAKEWNLDPATVRHYAAEASRAIRRRLRDTPEAKEEARAQVLQLFEVIRAKAMANGDSSSLRVALEATRLYGYYLGLEPAKRLDVTERGDDFFAGWTTEEKLAFSRDGVQPTGRAKRALRSIITTEGNGVDDDPTEPRH
jgi:hypothetical protein